MITVPSEGTIGTHRYTVEAADQFLLRGIGPMRVEDARAVVGLLSELAAKRRIYFLVDATEASVSLETRRYIIDNMKPEWLLGAAYFGANVLMRIAGKALTIGLLLKSRSPYEVTFVATEKEARDAIAQWRAKWK